VTSASDHGSVERSAARTVAIPSTGSSANATVRGPTCPTPTAGASAIRRALPTAEQCEGHGTLEARRAAFGALTDALVEELQFTPQPEVLAACRTEALMEAQLLAAGSVVTPEQELDASSEDDSVRYLNCEIVAVYW
jgi:hypothetical protein